MPNQIIRPESDAEIQAWQDVLSRCSSHDVYHTVEYHLAAQDQGEGSPVLLVVEESSEVVALPLLIRNLDEVGKLSDLNKFDATSVYGYGGPITSLPAVPANREEWSGNIGTALLQQMKSLELISVFTRMHPLIDTAWVFDAIGETPLVGPTVVIDLDQADEAHAKNMRQNYRRVVKKGVKAGVTVYEDSDWGRLDKFLEAYKETMQRVSANDYYFFEETLFINLRQRLGEKVKLFHAVVDDEIIGSAIFFVCGGIVQYHLGATFNAYNRYSPTAMIFDYVRRWGRDLDLKWFHLGGGVGGVEDSVFHFKSGLSKSYLNCFSARVIVDQQVYDQLCDARRRVLPEESGEVSRSSFFPEYRAPVDHVNS